MLDKTRSDLMASIRAKLTSSSPMGRLTTAEKDLLIEEGLNRFRTRMRRSERMQIRAILNDPKASRNDKVQAMREYPISVDGHIVPLHAATREQVELAALELERVAAGVKVEATTLRTIANVASLAGLGATDIISKHLDADVILQAWA